MTFIKMRDKMLEHFKQMTDEVTALYYVEADKEKLWELYLESIPVDKNPIFRKRREYDCSCCRSFIKSVGGIVTIKDNKMISIWDFDVDDDTFTASIKALREYVHSLPVAGTYVTKELRKGIKANRELTDGVLSTYDHFYIDIPDKFKNKTRKSNEELKGEFEATRNVFKRSLDEITDEAANIVLELISQGSLYRGEEHKRTIEAFLKYKSEYKDLNSDEKELFAWSKSHEAGMTVGRIRNHSIGTLLVDISNGIGLEEAVRKYEAMVAPSNYKRPKAIFTKRMLDDAKQTLSDMGYIDSLKRRFATLDDISINNILFSNRDAAKRISGEDVFEELSAETTINPKKFAKVEEVPIDSFINDILPTAKEIEMLLENRHTQNMVSLIAPQVSDSKSMFKWGNNFCWAYTGNIADSMKERVKSFGGNVTGDLRFSIQWNENGKDNVDLDAHCTTPVSHIYYAHKNDMATNGCLDVDIRVPDKEIEGTNKTAVENITWSDRNRMPDGTYLMFVEQFNGTLRHGFRAEIEFDSETYSFDYSDILSVGNRVTVAEIIVKNGKFNIRSKLPETHGVSSRTAWGINTNQFVPVSVVMYSPNYWDNQNSIGNKHYFFMLNGCANPETPNGFFNEYLNNELDKHKHVMEALGEKLAVASADDQLSGVGFSSTKHDSIIVKVKGAFERVIKVKI